jgi:hypothetical protein
MGLCDPIIFYLNKNFPRWVFLGLDSFGSSSGIIMGLSSYVTLINCISVKSGSCSEVINKDLDHHFLLCNVYGPYVDKENFWIYLLDPKALHS